MYKFKTIIFTWAFFLTACATLTAHASIQSNRRIEGMLTCSPSISINITPSESVTAYAVEEVLHDDMIPSSISYQGEWDIQTKTIRWGTFVDHYPRTLSYDLAGPDGSYSVCGIVSADGNDTKIPGISWIRFYCLKYSSLTRSIDNNSTCNPDVYLEVTPYRADAIVAIEEKLAQGLIPLNINENGIWDSQTNTIRWGTFVDQVPQTFTYQLTGQEGNYQIDGIASFDGSEASFSGDTHVNVLCPPYDNMMRIISNNYTCLPFISISVKPVDFVNAWAVEETIPFGLKPVHISDNGIWDSEKNIVRWGTLHDSQVHTFTYSVMGGTGNYEISGVISLDGNNYRIPGTTSTSVLCNSAKTEKPVFDPPDASPVPLKVRISSPTPGAEIRYTLDGSLPNVNSLLYISPIELRSETTIKAKAYSIAMAESDIVEAVYPELPYVNAANRTTHNMVCSSGVSIEIDPNTVAGAYSVEEFLPDNVIPVNISENGSWDEINKTIKWGTFLDHTKRTLSYDVIGHEGDYAISGLLSINGKNFAINGDNRIDSLQCGLNEQLERLITNNASCSPDVSINVSPSNDIMTYAIYEELPEGILPVNITEGGRWDSEVRKIRWGSFLDRRPRTLQYEIIGEIGSYPLSGQASFDGKNQSIPGKFSVGIQGNECSFDETRPVVVIHKEPDTEYSNQQYVLTIEADQGEIIYRLDSDQWITYDKPIIVGTGGFHTVEAQAADISGIVGMAVPVSFFIDNTPPSNCSIQINNNVQWTGTPSVTLTLLAIDTGLGMGQMRFSNDKANWSEPVDYVSIYNWFLSSGHGTRNVYAQFSDKLGNWTTTEIVDNIFLSGDNRPPDPTGLKVDRIEQNAIVLDWNQIIDPFGVTYHVYRSESMHGFFYEINTKPIDLFSILNKDHFTDTYVNEGKTYYYKIRAFLNGIPSENYSETIEVSTSQENPFLMSVTPISRLIKISETAAYSVEFQFTNNFDGNIMFHCIGLSESLDHRFYLNGHKMGKNLFVSQGDIALKINAGSAAELKEHQFVLKATHEETGYQQDFPLALTVVRNDAGGIHLAVEKTMIKKGEKTSIYGSVIPRTSNAKITLTLKNTDNSGDVLLKETFCQSFGEFKENDLITTLSIGAYELTAQWQDNQGQIHTSETKTIRIIKGKSIVSCLRESHLIPKAGQDFTIHGSIFPVTSSPLITLRVIDPLGNIEDIICEQNSSGEYAKTHQFFKQKGVYKFKAYWPGNETYIGCESEELIVPVEVDNGRAIIVGGGYAKVQNILWETTVNICSSVYWYFKKKKYTDDEICLLLHAESIDYNGDLIQDHVVDITTPTVEKLIHVIKNEYINILSEEIPLFVFMQGHGTADGRFKVLGNDEYIHDYELNEAFEYVQEQTNCTIIVILESCYSGNFIHPLSGFNRVILSSTGNSVYATDEKGWISFSQNLFSRLEKGDSLFKSFGFARFKLTQLGYLSPLLDDNGDGIPSTDQDGLLSANVYLHGELWPGGEPEISQVTLTVLDTKTSVQIEATVFKGEKDISRVWANVIIPGTEITGIETSLTLPKCELSYYPTTGLYRGVLSDLTVAGKYQFMVIAEDIDHDMSEIFIKSIEMGDIRLPGDVNQDQWIDLKDVILMLKHVSGQ
jgi:hypothetical protein